jgi:hypothetical protein
LIIFSGSSARSTMSFRLARIKVLTRSKSPMVLLLSIFEFDHSRWSSLKKPPASEGGRYTDFKTTRNNV